MSEHLLSGGQDVRNELQRLEEIFNRIQDPIFVKDRQHRLLIVNDAECRLAGVSREKLVGRTDYDFFPKEQVDIFWAKDEEVFNTGQENINEEEITDAQGNKRIIVTRKTLYVDGAGNKFIVGIIRDITDRKMVEQQLEHKVKELEKFVKTVMDREQKIIELKAEVNCLLEKLQVGPFYPAGKIDSEARNHVSKMLENRQTP